MANTKPRSTRNSGKTAARSAPTETEKENEALKLEIIRLKKRQKLDRSGTSAPSGSGTAKAMEREVGKTHHDIPLEGVQIHQERDQAEQGSQVCDGTDGPK